MVSQWGIVGATLAFGRTTAGTFDALLCPSPLPGSVVKKISDRLLPSYQEAGETLTFPKADIFRLDAQSKVLTN